MHFTRLLTAAILSLTAISAAQAQEPYPLEYWALRDVISNVTVSPDGEHLALMKIESRDGNPIIEIHKVDTLGQEAPIRLAADPMEFTSVRWVSDTNLVMNVRQKVRPRIDGYNQGVYAFELTSYDLDTEKFVKLGDNANVIEVLPNEPDTILISQNRTNASFNEEDPFADFRPRAYYRMNLDTGAKTLVLRSGGKFASASFDRDGYPRFTSEYRDQANEIVYYFRRPGEGSWTEFARESEESQVFNPIRLVGFHPTDPSVGYVITPNGGNLAGLYEFDFDKGELGDLIYQNDRVDVITPQFSPNSWGEAPRLVGALYIGLKYETAWFDEETQALYEDLEAALPNAYLVSITSMSRDGTTFVVSNSGPKDPGTYYLIRDGVPTLIGSENPLVKPENLATIEHFWYEARDGRMIPGHITVPAHGEPPYPLVVMPHGGPYVSVIPIWDEWGQMLANNGYLVFEPNYRGSTDFGVDHFWSSMDEHGFAMQDDKDDGALYLVEQGLADPDRMAMFGWSYGGYAALVAASRDPQIYNCTIAGAAVADPWMQYNYRRGEPGSLDDRIGRQRGTGINPYEEVDNINIPLLMIHPDLDQRVPFDHYRKYKPKVEKAGKDAEFVVLEGADHFSNTLFYEHQLELYESMISFLDRKCGMN